MATRLRGDDYRPPSQRKSVMPRHCIKNLNENGARLGFLLMAVMVQFLAARSSQAQPKLQKLAGIATIKVEYDGRNFYGSPLGYDGKSLGLLRWDGRISVLSAKPETKIEIIDQNFLPYTPEELQQKLQKEFGNRYRVSLTEHYVVVHPVGKSSVWADPFEELHKHFLEWFVDRGIRPAKPRFPMIAIVHRSRGDFDRYMKGEIKLADPKVVGFYSRKSNRMSMYDPSQKLRVADETWLYGDDTIVHEATHQSAFNTGVHSRFNSPPLWVTEGLAMLFETCGYNRSRKYRNAGDRLNRTRLAQLQTLELGSRLPANLLNMIGDDRLFELDPPRAYALSWGLCYFLAEAKTDQFIQFLKTDSSRKPFTTQTPAEQLQTFASVFGNDFDKLRDEMAEFFEELL